MSADRPDDGGRPTHRAGQRIGLLDSVEPLLLGGLLRLQLGLLLRVGLGRDLLVKLGELSGQLLLEAGLAGVGLRIGLLKVGGQQKDGYSSGQALDALEETANQVLPNGYGFEFVESSAQEREASGKTVYALSLGMLFVFLSLAALYESWKVPFTVIFGIPTGFFGASLAAMAFHVYNDIYFQIGLLTIIGLAAKNAILIVEYAKVRVDNGMDVMKASIEASQIRLRPILMTSLAFILGNIPLALSTGAGSNSRSEMGIAVVFGVLSATVFQIFIVPMLFVVIERIHGFKRPKKGISVSK